MRNIIIIIKKLVVNNLKIFQFYFNLEIHLFIMNHEWMKIVIIIIKKNLKSQANLEKVIAN